MYPLGLVLITFIFIKIHARNVIDKFLVLAWKPFHGHVTHLRRSWDSRASIINAFSTFLLLNFSKLIFVSDYSLYATELSIHCWLYIMGSIIIDHLCILNLQWINFLNNIFLISAAFLVVFFLIPTFLLCLLSEGYSNVVSLYGARGNEYIHWYTPRSLQLKIELKEQTLHTQFLWHAVSLFYSLAHPCRHNRITMQTASSTAFYTMLKQFLSC